MAARVVKHMKKSAQDGTTVTLVADDNIGENHPADITLTQLVATFTATPASMFGAAAADGRKYRVTIEQYT